jgi:hypothetical protein
MSWVGGEPALARSGQHALFGVAEESGEVLQADVGVTQLMLRGLAADVVDEGGEAGVFCGEAPLQCPWVQAEL